MSHFASLSLTYSLGKMGSPGIWEAWAPGTALPLPSHRPWAVAIPSLHASLLSEQVAMILASPPERCGQSVEPTAKGGSGTQQALRPCWLPSLSYMAGDLFIHPFFALTRPVFPVYLLCAMTGAEHRTLKVLCLPTRGPLTDVC